MPMTRTANAIIRETFKEREVYVSAGLHPVDLLNPRRVQESTFKLNVCVNQCDFDYHERLACDQKYCSRVHNSFTKFTYFATSYT